MIPPHVFWSAANMEQRRLNSMSHNVVPCKHCEELGCCSVCGAGEYELEDYSCKEFAEKIRLADKLNQGESQ